MVRAEVAEQVVIPLWTAAVLDQLPEADRALVVAKLDRFATSHDHTMLKVLSSPGTEQGEGPLYELKVGSELRVLLLRRDETRQFEVVGINRRTA